MQCSKSAAGLCSGDNQRRRSAGAYKEESISLRFWAYKVKVNLSQIIYSENVENLTPTMLQGFFQGWPKAPSAEVHLQILRKSDAVILAVDQEKQKVIGFITAITDKVLTAHIPLLEVLPEYRKSGIGSELVRRMLSKLYIFYGVSLSCDPAQQSFYARFGMKPAISMNIRNIDLINRPQKG